MMNRQHTVSGPKGSLTACASLIWPDPPSFNDTDVRHRVGGRPAFSPAGCVIPGICATGMDSCLNITASAIWI